MKKGVLLSVIGVALASWGASLTGATDKFYARFALVEQMANERGMDMKTAGIDALDTVYSDVNNEEGFIAEATLIKKLGFDGKSVINPRQIEPLHKVFMPSEKDLNKAKAVMGAYEEAMAKGSGVVALNGKMIDKPVVIRAQRLLELNELAGVREVEEI